MKKLSKKALKTINGGETVYIRCEFSGRVGQIHNVETFEDIAQGAATICKNGESFSIS
ncbi:bacteriocin [Chryseobacterium contaminans]|uniref:Bacteriocin-type signal sequence-containing protein n=1 Tax=Chryseobacterium contaminans TaxID=1423959 RepID=A0A1M6Y4X9_9FLAO|nr:bacteriocin [Chryseobacterium contaminans]SHL13109.1 bacteriocin-type signal sequence-containing protein [Chryseobacterium contaminans]